MAILKLIFDVLDNLVSGDLTNDGEQWSEEIDTTTADTDVEVLKYEINHGNAGSILMMHHDLIASFKAVSSGTADVKWKWQVSDDGTNWVDLHDYVTEENIGIDYVEREMSGHFAPETNIEDIPYYIRLVIQCNEVNEGRAKVKNSSYARTVYTVSV
jgi:hypothetical protein